MILTALVHLYEELCKQGKIQAEGWGIAKVSHRILLDKEGHLCGIISARKKVQKGKKESEVANTKIVPLHLIRPGKTIRANFLCDNVKYFFGLVPKERNGKSDSGNEDKDNEEYKRKQQRAIKCFEAAKNLHHDILDNCNVIEAKAILHYFDTWNPYEAIGNLDNLADILLGDNFIFNVDGKDVLDLEDIRNVWETYYLKKKNKEPVLMGQCLVTGKKNQRIARLHPKIKGLTKGEANLVSFNQSAFCSYGGDDKKGKGKNAPVSERAAFAYGSALNALLADRSHSQIIGDTTIVYWSEHGISACQDFMMSFLGNHAGIDDHTLDTIVTHMRNGLPVDLEGVEISPDEPFYILGLAPNAGRISVRLFWRNTFRELAKNLALHQERMKLAGPSWKKQNIPLCKILEAMEKPKGKEQAAKPNGKGQAVSPLLSGSLFRAVLQNTKYPASAFQNILLRIFAEQDKAADGGRSAVEKISHTKAAFIKAYLLKNGQEHWEGNLQMALNENCNDVSYVLGRMFSLLENIQQSANPTINTTIKERYFNSACATPAFVFPILLKLANTYLSKLDERKAVYFKKRMGALMDKIIMPEEGIPFPARLTLEEQGAFILGYYQETQARYKGKEEE